MKLSDLKPYQIQELKERYLCDHQDSVSYEELCKADLLVSDEQLEEEYGGTDFVEDDFGVDPDDYEDEFGNYGEGAAARHDLR